MDEKTTSAVFGRTALYPYLRDVMGWSDVFALLVCGGATLLVALLVRMIIYYAIRSTGQSQYTAVWQTWENTTTVAMFFAGCFAGYALFGNGFSAFLSGVGWAFITTAIALQALTANEKKQ